LIISISQADAIDDSYARLSVARFGQPTLSSTTVEEPRRAVKNSAACLVENAAAGINGKAAPVFGARRGVAGVGPDFRPEQVGTGRSPDHAGLMRAVARNGARQPKAGNCHDLRKAQFRNHAAGLRQARAGD